MLYEEAQWVGRTLLSICEPGYKILNLGSSGLIARTVLQPHMEEFIFAPLRKKGVVVIHSDIINDQGVDLQGDFTDVSFVSKIEEMNFDGVLCCNLMEHLENREPLISTLNRVLSKGGFLLITVPYNYPYHLDPIDNLYRPTPLEVTKEFPELENEIAEIIKGRRNVFFNGKYLYQNNYFEQLINDPKLFLRLILRCFLPFYKFKIWKFTISNLYKMFSPFTVSCILLKSVRRNQLVK